MARTGDPTDSIQLQIKYEDPSGAPAVYATNLVVQHTPYEFLLHFFDIVPPLLAGTDEEKRAAALTLDSVTARPLVRVIVAANRMEEFVELMQQNLSRFREKAAAMGARK